MKRTSLLLAAVLALVLAACGADQPDTTASPTESATPTASPTPAATPSPTASPDATDDGSGSGFTGELADALPDEVDGLRRQDTGELAEMMEEMVAGQLQQQGLDAEEVDFAWAMYGQGELLATAIRVPGLSSEQLRQLAGMMSGMPVEGGQNLETEQLTVSGKEVTRVSVAGESQSIFLYAADDAMFTVVAESEELAEELLAQLP